MMGLWKFEFCKLYKNRIICLLLLSCLFLNIFLAYRQTANYDYNLGCYPSSIKKVYENLEQIETGNRISWLKKQTEVSDYDMDFEESMDFYEMITAQRIVLDYMEKINGYQEYLESIQGQANLITSSFLFEAQDSFSKRNAELIPQKYGHLQDLQPQPENSQGILLAVQMKETDIILLVFIFLCVYFFFTMEREDGTMAFARGTYFGGKTLCKTKIFVVIFASIAGTLLLYGSNLLMGAVIYGLGDLGRCIQSVEGYLASSWSLTVGGYLCLFFVGKAMVAIFAAVLAIGITLLTKSTLRTSLSILAVLALEYIMYTKIPVHSWLDLLRQCNLFSFLRTEQFFQTYATINLFSYPISSLVVSVMVCILLTVIGILFSVSIYEKASRSENGTIGKRKKENQKDKRVHTLTYYEMAKIFKNSGAFFLLILFCVIQFSMYSKSRPFVTLDELYYRHYMEQLEGDVTPEKLQFIAEEGERILQLEKKLESKSGEIEQRSSEITKLESQLKCKNAYLRIAEQAERIGEKGVFLNEDAYGYLLNTEEQVYQAGKLMLLWVLAFYTVFVMEYMARMPSIWNTIPNGRKKISKRKWMFLLGYVFVSCLAAEFFFLYYRMKACKISTLAVPIQYLEEFQDCTFLSAGGFLALLSLAKLLLGVCICIMIAWLSKKTKNTVTVLLTSGSIAGVLYFLLSIFVC